MKRRNFIKTLLFGSILPESSNLFSKLKNKISFKPKKIKHFSKKQIYKIHNLEG